MLGRAAMLAIPPAAIGLTAAVLLGPGATRPALGARVYGAPAPAPGPVALRVVVLTSLYGVEEVASGWPLAVGADGVGVWSGPSGAFGAAEVGFASRTAAPTLTIASGNRLLARGGLDLGRAHPVVVAAPRPLEGTKRGELEVEVVAAKVPFAVGVAGALTVRVLDQGAPIEAEVKLGGGGSSVRETGVEGNTRSYEVTPLFQLVELEADATVGGRSGHWEGNLPLVAGAMAIERSPSGARIVAPAPREQAFVSAWGREGRRAGAIVPLASGAAGSTASPLLDAALSAPGVVAVTLSSDPLERGAGTITWALEGARAAPPELELLLDGMPQATAIEEARANRVRRWGLLVLGAAALAEVFLLLARSRRAQIDLEAHLAAASDDPSDALKAAKSPAAFWALASASLVAAAFAIVAALAAYR